MPDDFVWTQLVELLAMNAPGTARSLRVGVNATIVEQAAATLQQRWPQDLRRYFTVQGGQDFTSDGTGGEVIPHQELVSLAESLRLRDELISAFAVTPEDVSSLAGTVVSGFHSSYVPIAAGDGDFIFCDTRPGPLWGNVGQFSYDELDDSINKWASVNSMLESAFTSIRDATPFQFYVPVVREGLLAWEIESDDREYAEQVDQIYSYFLEYPNGFAEPTPMPPNDGVDLMEVQRAVLAAAAEKYGSKRITQITPNGHYLSRIPGHQMLCAVGVDGVFRGFTVTVTGADGSFSVEPPPQD